MKNAIKGIIWDLDGTLYDPFRPGMVALEASFKMALEKGFLSEEKGQELKEKINGEELYSYMFWKEAYEQDRKNSGLDELPLSYIFKKAWDCHSEEYCKSLERFWYKGFYSRIVPFSWVNPTFLELQRRNIAMGLVSDSPVKFGIKKLQALKLVDYFDLNNTIWTKETGQKKPSKEPFYQISRLIGCAPFETLVVGDVYDKDGRGARNAGMSFLPVTYGCDFDQFLAQLWDLIGTGCK